MLGALHAGARTAAGHEAHHHAELGRRRRRGSRVARRQRAAGLIVLTYEGSGVLVGDTKQRLEGLWFIAHEAAHFWLGQTVAYEYARDAWITEGGADLLAMRAMALRPIPSYDSRADTQRAIADCISLTQRRGVETARERGEQRAYYACGAVFGLVAESGSGRSFFNVRDDGSSMPTGPTAS